MFSLEPKISINELYNRDTELKELDNFIKFGKILLLKGKRRVGKTSLIRSFLSTQDNPYITINCENILKNWRSADEDFELKIREKISKLTKLQKISNLIKSVEGLKIGNFEMDFYKKENFDLLNFLSEVDKKFQAKNKKLVIVFEQSENLRFYGKGGSGIVNLLSYSYDNFSNIVYVLSYYNEDKIDKFVRAEKMDSPLFGRFLDKIEVKIFSVEDSYKYLMKGFKKEGIRTKTDEIKTASIEFGGIVGYLTLYGYIVVREKNWEKAFETTKKIILNSAKEELKQLKRLSKNYINVLRAISYGIKNFSTIRDYVSFHNGKISNQTLSNILKSLNKKGFIQIQYEKSKKEYCIENKAIEKILKDHI